MSCARLKTHYLIALIVAVFMCACHAGSRDVDKQTMREQLKEAAKVITKRTIVEGEFWGMHIGDPKGHVLETLIRRGVQDITPLLLRFLKAHTIGELDGLRDAESLVIGEKYVATIRFNGDRIKEVLVDSAYPWKRELEATKTRGQMFAVLANILEQEDTVVSANLLGPDTIMLASLDEDERKLLMTYDAWELSQDDSNGHWVMRLEFGDDLLAKIIVRHSPFEGL